MVTSSPPLTSPPAGFRSGAAAESIARRARGRALSAGIIVALAGGAVVTSLGPALGGTVPAFGRVALGLFGIVAGACLVTRRDLGWRLALIWALAQIPYIVLSRHAGADVGLTVNATTQVVALPLALAERIVAGGVVTYDYAFGINLVGVVLTLWLRARRADLTAAD
jgi:hypothetical protein